MRLIDGIRQAWDRHGRLQKRHASLILDEQGLMLGAGTVLAARSSGVMDVDSDAARARILALLTAAYGAVPPTVLGNIDRAAKAEHDGNRVLAAIHLAHANLPPIGDDEGACRRLFFFEKLIDEGTAPAVILRALGPVDEFIERGNPYHDERGRFSGPGGAVGPIPVAYKPAKQKPAVTAKPEQKPWEKRPNSAFRQKLAEMESSTDKPNDGYGQKAANGALGRYQMLSLALKDAGWKEDGVWTETAKEAGITSDQDFLDMPEAQEQALTALLEKYHDELKKNGSLDDIGKSITDSAGGQLTVTEAGLMAAAHKEGAAAVHGYLNAAENGTLSSPPTPKIANRWRNIEGRLRKAANTPYDFDAK